LVFQDRFTILSGIEIEMPTINWHIDFRLAAELPDADAAFPAATYYKEIPIKPFPGWELGKDIKIPWEVGRLQHLPLLAYGVYREKKTEYYQKMQHSFLDWNAHNPPLLGPQWMCPMDVGIRAVNLVWSFFLSVDFIKHDLSFAQTLTASLYDHLLYLERNWEIYDYKTSNHYLGDLIGYFYLCYYFKNLPGIKEKAEWCSAEILREFDKQVFSEGTDYEGSTAYHGLVTEFFYHAFLLAELFSFSISADKQTKLSAMLSAIDWYTPQNGSTILVGDEDGGKLLPFGLCKQLIKKVQADTTEVTHKDFVQFGISIYKDPELHLSLRHHSYNERQPSGHFHIDVGGITVNYQGLTLITDPGSYIYTPSVEWRNGFRSAQMHSTSYLLDHEAIHLDDKLFLLRLPSCENKQVSSFACGIWESTTTNKLYENYGWLHTRSIQFNQNSKCIEITDIWKATGTKFISTKIGCCFMLGNLIQPLLNGKSVILTSNTTPVANIISDWNLEIEDSWLSHSYGSKVATQKLTAKIDTGESYLKKITIIQLL